MISSSCWSTLGSVNHTVIYCIFRCFDHFAKIGTEKAYSNYVQDYSIGIKYGVAYESYKDKIIEKLIDSQLDHSEDSDISDTI